MVDSTATSAPGQRPNGRINGHTPRRPRGLKPRRKPRYDHEEVFREIELDDDLDVERDGPRRSPRPQLPELGPPSRAPDPEPDDFAEPDEDDFEGADDAGSSASGRQRRGGECNEEDYLLGLGEPADAGRHVADEDGDEDEFPEADATDWHQSDAFKLISRSGPAAPEGNQVLAVPRWVLAYFAGDVVTALVFGQILYWFGRNQQGQPRALRRDDDGHRVIDKTHQQLAEEVGLPNKRQVERALSICREKSLLGFQTIGYGAARCTRIRLIPSGVLKAYHEGCAIVEGVATKESPDRSGGT